MKKQVLFSLLLVALTSCGTLPQSSITVNGKTYKTGFYKYYGESMHVLGIERKGLTTCDYEQGKYHYWKLTGYQFDFYYGQHEESLLWDPALYCVTDQLAEAKAYYTNLENFDYYIGEYLYPDASRKVENDKYYDAIEHAIKIMITRPLSRKQNKKIELNNFGQFTFFRKSKDDLLTTTRDQFLYSEETGFIYMASYFDDSESAVYYTLSKENNELLTELYKSLYQITIE